MSISRQRRPLPQTQEVTIHKFAFSFVKMKAIIQSKGPPRVSFSFSGGYWAVKRGCELVSPRPGLALLHLFLGLSVLTVGKGLGKA